MMAAPSSPFIADEREMALALDLLRRGHLGRISWSPALVDALTRAAFPFACEFWAALAPMERRGDGWLRLDVPVSAQCWPAGAEATADRRFAPGEVRIEALTGRWQDANGSGSGFAYVGAAARVWRRPDDPCGPAEAARRVLAAFGAAVLLQRAEGRGYPTTGPAALPFVPDAPPLAPDLPGEEPQPVAPPATTTADAGQDGPLVVMPALVVDAVVEIANGLLELAENPACADAIRAGSAEPDVVARAALLVRGLALRALDGAWGTPAPAPAEAIRRAEVICLARARRSRGNHLRAVQPAAVADAPTAENLKAIAASIAELARAAADPVRGTALRAFGVRTDLLADGERLAARLAADADHIAAALATAPNDNPPAA
ncbi:hypothetical protein [Xanthobacter wiegelii]|uniref:hypothetical protein n=1 Tax=Xanthobacter wiegelii TaxID=3119913 RepID=UPI00372AAEF8